MRFSSRNECIEALSQIPTQLSQKVSIPLHGLSPCIQLKDYQKQGVEWLASFAESPWNGILADDMGLGKTLQSIAFLVYLKNTWRHPLRVLLIVPLSVLNNWRIELETFAPCLHFIVFHGDKNERQEKMKKCLESDMILTTFEMILQETEFLTSLTLNYMIIDEGHRLKNRQSKLFQTLSSFTTRKRLLLTGKSMIFDSDK